MAYAGAKLNGYGDGARAVVVGRRGRTRHDAQRESRRGGAGRLGAGGINADKVGLAHGQSAYGAVGGDAGSGRVAVDAGGAGAGPRANVIGS